MAVGESDEERREELYREYESFISNAFNGKVTASVDNKSGKVSFSKVESKDGESLSEGEQSAFDIMNGIATNEDIQVNQTLIDSDSKDVTKTDGTKGTAEGVLFGSENGNLDIDDLQNLQNNFETRDAFPARSVLVHETVEQSTIAKDGFSLSHDAGIKAANSTRSFQRVSGTSIKAGYAVKDGNNNVILLQQTKGNGLRITTGKVK